MKNISEALKSHLQSDVTTLAFCWKISLEEEMCLCFTSHDKDIVFEELTYKSKTGFTADTYKTALQQSSFFEVFGILDSDDLNEDDIKKGRFDNADIEIFIINYKAPQDGRVLIKKGRIAKAYQQEGKYVMAVSGLSNELEKNITETYTPYCRAKFCDVKCGLDKDDYKTTGSLTGIIDERNFIDSSRDEEDGYFDKGIITFLNGANAGYSTEIRKFEGTNIQLSIPFPAPMQPGDEYEITAGCDKKFQTCKSRFNNAVNFRGEPHIPGIDKIFKTV